MGRVECGRLKTVRGENQKQTIIFFEEGCLAREVTNNNPLLFCVIQQRLSLSDARGHSVTLLEKISINMVEVETENKKHVAGLWAARSRQRVVGVLEPETEEENQLGLTTPVVPELAEAEALTTENLEKYVETNSRWVAVGNRCSLSQCRCI